MLLFVVDHLTPEESEQMAKIYSEYVPLFKNRAYKYVNDISISQDIAHECMKGIMQYFDSVKKVPEDKLRVYLFACIENEIKRYLEKSSKETSFMETDLADSNYLYEDIEIYDDCEQNCEYDEIRAAFDKLRERDKNIIMMKYDLEMSDELIAHALGVSKESVRMTVRRCVKRLKKLINQMKEETL